MNSVIVCLLWALFVLVVEICIVIGLCCALLALRIVNKIKNVDNENFSNVRLL